MNGNAALAIPSKPLPPPAKLEKLPPPPPTEAHHDDWSTSPPPPPKIVHGSSPEIAQGPNRPLPQIDVSASLHAFHPALGSAPLTPNSAVSPSVPPSPSADGRPKKSNPLLDLIDTEKLYVDLLTGIIRKVAAAWSRSNLPPPELDTMFRSIEGIYKVNRTLLSKLKDIGTNPSSPKALGDLLMRWIDDLETPYTVYSTKYCSGFDAWEPIQSNPRLRTVLAMFSSSSPPPLPPGAPAHPAEPPIWTLDQLFVLPKGRLKYYRKLYTRLLKSTTPGRSDHRLLTGALEKLDRLLATLDGRATVQVGASQTATQVEAQKPPVETVDEVVIDMRSRDSTSQSQRRIGDEMSPPQRTSDSARGSGSMSSGDRQSEETAPTSEGRVSTSTLSMPITDLERRLSMDRTLDIFTMNPKQVRLQISPPTLHYSRELRFSADVVLSLIPKSTGVEVVQDRGHVFILTDLLLVCERMTPRERSHGGPDGPDMWLLYPPLAGKHLRVAPVNDSTTALAVTIMRKETLILHAGSPGLRDKLIAEFRECIDAATALFPSTKNATPPPPVPAIHSAEGIPRPPLSPLDRTQAQSAGEAPSARTSGSMSPPSRALSPSSAISRRSNEPNMVQSARTSAASGDMSLADSMARLALQSDLQMPHGSPGHANPMYPPRSSSTAHGPQGGHGPPPAPGQLVRGPSFKPGQVMPPQSYGPGQVAPSQASGPGRVMPQGSFRPGQGPPQPLSPGQMIPHREPSLRSAPPDGDYMSPPQGPPQGPGRSAPGPFMGGPPSGVPENPRSAMGNGHPAPFARPPVRPPSEPSYSGGIRKSPSSRSLASQFDQMSIASAPPMPGYPGDLAPPRPNFLPRTNSSSSVYSLPSQLQAPQPRPFLPSAQMGSRFVSTADSMFQEPSPPESPVEETPPHTGPTTSTVSAQMKCKVFLKQHHAQWKSLGAAKLKLYRESPTNIKQLVVEADNKDSTVLISTIILADGVERVGKTGVAVELSDRGKRTGIIYMIQLRNEKSAIGLFDSLLAGSDRSAVLGRA
ncbi:hypothetical protein AcV5_004640 [Taiwanofungus camphoratus]|nr:hypothetical protein AcV5_004640 [Antrodia cinnamomea]